MENLVAIALHKHQLDGNLEVYYWRNTQLQEVDFVLRHDGRVIALIQVCTDLSDEKTHHREVNALLIAGRDLSCNNRIILTMDDEATKTEDWFGIRGEIRSIPLWKWLQEPGIPGI